MTTPSASVVIYCFKCKVKTGSTDVQAVTLKNGRPRHQGHLRGLRHQEVSNRRALLIGYLPALSRHAPRTFRCWSGSSNHWIAPITRSGHLPKGNIPRRETPVFRHWRKC